MDQKSLQKSFLQQSHIQEQNQPQNISNQSSEQSHPIFSQFLASYLDQTGVNPAILNNQTKTRIINSKGKVHYENKFIDQIDCKIVRVSSDSLEIKIWLGNFSAVVSVLTLQIDLQPTEESTIGRGTFAEVFCVPFQGFQHAVKLVSLGNDAFQKIQQVYKEYLLLLIANSMSAGPNLTNLFGYDIVVFSNYALFSMQKCQVKKYFCNLENHEAIKKDLLPSLISLHSQRICHCDIKPSNIGYSNQLKKYVFLDFGLSRTLKEEVGHKSITGFVGTYSYSSAEMRRLFLIRTRKEIDLYYNDVVGLKKCFDEKQKYDVEEDDEELEQESISFESGKQPFCQSILKNVASITRIKFSLLQSQYLNSLRLIIAEKIMVSSAAKIFFEEEVFQKMQKQVSFSTQKQAVQQLFSEDDSNYFSNQVQTRQQYLECSQQSQNRFDKQKIILQNIIYKKIRENVQKIEISRFDKLFSVYLDSFYSGQKTNQNFTLSSMLFFEVNFKSVQEFWKRPKAVEAIFSFLEPLGDHIHSMNSKISRNSYLSLIDKLFTLFSSEDNYCQMTDSANRDSSIIMTEKLRFVWLNFLEYFKAIKNIYNLKILKYEFLLIEDLPSVNQIDQFLFSYYEEEKDYGSYLLHMLVCYVCYPLYNNFSIVEVIKHIKPKIQQIDVNKDKIIAQMSARAQQDNNSEELKNYEKSLEILKTCFLQFINIPEGQHSFFDGQAVRNLIQGFIAFNPEGRLQKMFKQEKIYQPQETETRDSSDISQKYIKRLPIAYNKIRNKYYLASKLKFHLFNYEHYSQSLPQIAKMCERLYTNDFIGFNSKLLNMVYSHEHILKGIGDHLQLYSKSPQLVNQKFWTNVFCSHISPLAFMQQYLNFIPSNFGSFLQIRRYWRNLEQISKQLVMKELENYNGSKQNSRDGQIQTIKSIRQIVKKLQQNDEKRNKLQDRFKNLTSIEINLDIVDYKFISAVTSMKHRLLSLRNLFLVSRYSKQEFVWVLYAMQMLLSMQKQNAQKMSSNFTNDNKKSKEEIYCIYRKQCSAVIVNLCDEIYHQQQHTEVIEWYVFSRLRAICLLYQQKWQECLTYLKNSFFVSKPSQHEVEISPFHARTVAYILKIIPKAVIRSDMLMKIYQNEGLESISKNEKLYLFIFMAYTITYPELEPKVSARLLKLCVFRFQEFSNTKCVRDKLYKIHWYLNRHLYRSRRKAIIISRLESKNDWNQAQKYWYICFRKKIQKISRFQIAEKLSYRFDTLK